MADEIEKNRQEIKRLQTLKEAGQIDARQETRLRFLTKKVAKGVPNAQKEKGPFAKIKDEKVRGQLKDDAAAADYAAKQGIKFSNAGTQTGPFGSQTIETDAQGNTSVNVSLDPSQQAIVNQDTNLSGMGRDLAAQLFKQFGEQAFNPQSLDRKKLEDAYFQNQTKRLDEDYQKTVAAKKQELYDTGNFEGSPRFNAEMGRLDGQYQDQRRAIQNDAVTNSGAEQTRQFGIDQSTRNQQVGELQGFAGFGTGARLPQFQGFQGVGYKQPSPSELSTANQSLENQKKELEIAMQKLNRSGGGSQTPAERNPFVNSLPPGA